MTASLTNYDGFCVHCDKPIYPNEPHWVRYDGKVILDEVLCDSCMKISEWEKSEDVGVREE